MPRKLMVQYDCSRCHRQWFVPFQEDEEIKDPPSFALQMDGFEKDLSVTYEELCESCAKAVSNYCRSLALVREDESGAKREAPGASGG